MRSRFPSLLFPAIIALILSACATTGGDAPVPAAAPAAATAPQDVATPESMISAEPAPVEEIPVAAAVPLQPEPSASAVPVAPAVAAPAAVAPAPAPAPPAREAPPSSPFLFNVVTETKDASHPYYGVGHRMGFAVNGVQGKPLVLVRGKTYRFSVDAGIQHDFYLSSSDVGWGAATYVEGVSGQFIYEGVVTFTPGAQTPDLLYYQCRNHRNMGGPMYIVNEGQENLSIAELQAARGGKIAGAQAGPEAAQQRNVSAQQIQQKIQFADMFINQSAVVARIEASGNAMAQELHRGAKENFQTARAALAAGDQAKALTAIEEATRMMSEASRLVPQASSGEAEKQRFAESYESVQAFLASYERNYQQAVKGGSKPRAINLAQIRDTMSNARGLADDGKYNEAISMLGGAQDTLTTALSEMLHDQTIVHELKFETPRDEYEYELTRYQGYEALVPLAIRQRNPNEQTVKLMMQYVDRAKEVKALSEPEAAKGNYGEAILMLQGATSNIERALQVMGVR